MCGTNGAYWSCTPFDDGKNAYSFVFGSSGSKQFLESVDVVP